MHVHSCGLIPTGVCPNDRNSASRPAPVSAVCLSGRMRVSLPALIAPNHSPELVGPNLFTRFATAFNGWFSTPHSFPTIHFETLPEYTKRTPPRVLAKEINQTLARNNLRLLSVNPLLFAIDIAVRTTFGNINLTSSIYCPLLSNALQM